MLKLKKVTELTKKTPIILGIDMGGWTAKCAIADTEGNIYHKFVVETKHGDEAIPHFYLETKREIEKLGLDYDKQVKAVGFGCVGPLSVGNEVSIRAHKVGWENYPAARVARELFKKPVFLINDARSIAYGEWKQGAGQKYKTFAIFSLGNGIGGGLILEGKLYEGAHNFANEFGHGGDLQNQFACQCKLKGCPEGIASALGIEKYFQVYIKENPKSSVAKRQEELKRDIRIQDIADLITAKDHDAFEAFSKPLRSLAQAMSIIIYAVDPEAILIGGGPTAMGNVVIEAIMVHLREMVWESILEKLEIKLCELKNDAGIVGVIENAIDQLKKTKGSKKNGKQ